MQCDFCQEEGGLLLMTNQETGDTQSIGTACMPPFLKAMSSSWGCWPDLDELLTPEVVEAKARELGIWPEPPATPATSAVAGATNRKAGTPRPQRAAKAAAATTATEQAANYADVPETLLSKDELAARAQTGHDTLQAVTGGQ